MSVIPREKFVAKPNQAYALRTFKGVVGYASKGIEFSFNDERGSLYYFNGEYYERVSTIFQERAVFRRLKVDYAFNGYFNYFAYCENTEDIICSMREVEKETLEHFLSWRNVQKYSAGVICIHPVSGQILGVTRRNKPDDWGFVGGSVEPGETTEMAANREFKEETGVALTQSLTFIVRFPDNEWEVDVYIASREDALEMTKHFTTIPKEVEKGILVGYVDYATILKGTFAEFNSKLLNTYLANSMYIRS